MRSGWYIFKIQSPKIYFILLFHFLHFSSFSLTVYPYLNFKLNYPGSTPPLSWRRTCCRPTRWQLWGHWPQTGKGSRRTLKTRTGLKETTFLSSSLMVVPCPYTHGSATNQVGFFLVFSSVSDPYSLNLDPDPVKNLNPDPDPERPWIRTRILAISLHCQKKTEITLLRYYKFLSSKEVN